jgi:3-deoxy-D-manno-octulosonic-acid transferase
MRESLGVGSRKIIVTGSPTDAEFNEFIQSYNELYGKLTYEERPLLIIGFRNRRNNNELKLLNSLSGQSIAVRTDDKASLPDVKNNNALILNTSGELLRMYALADVAIVGNDRNIFEPASQKKAILYFDGSWGNNKDAKKILVEAGAAEIFSKERLGELINTPDRAKKMGVDGLEAVEAYRKEVLLMAEEFALKIIGQNSLLRKKYFSWKQELTRSQSEISPQSLRGILYGIRGLVSSL